jgi:hypothetical protein
MAIFTEYAEVLTPEHLQYKAYAAGIKKNPPGMVLADVLRGTGGVYEIELGLPADFKERLRQVAELTSDTELLAIANRGRASVSLEPLRGVDLQTRVVFGHRISYTQEDNERLGLKQPPDFDPKNTFYVERTDHIEE